MARFDLFYLLLILFATGCGRPTSRSAGTAAGPERAASGESAARFTDVTEVSGIRFRHTSGRSGRFFLPETLGAGCAFLDYNNDGRLDLFLVNGSRLPGFSARGPFHPALYRNEGDGRFTDVTRAAGLAVDCYGLGVAVADYDGDGDVDLYLTAMGPNHLYRNNGDDTFTDVTKKAGVEDPHFSTSAAWFDYDRDGDLDLFVCNYCRWSPALNQVCPDSLGRKHLCGPTYYKGDSSTLYRNDGDGTFTDVTKEAGLYDTVGKALGVVVWDVDDDGWLDPVVAKDMEPNLLYRNNGDGTFTERGVEAGIAYSGEGKTRAGMGIDTGDTTNTGKESVLIGNNAGQGLAQYLPDADGAAHLTDVAGQTGLFEPSLPFSTFGAAFVDYDGDGFRDIFTANGHIDANIYLDGHYTFEQTLFAFHNQGDGKFVSAGEGLGPVFQEKRLWRGLAVGDYDSDGDPDLLVSACDGRPALLRNDGWMTADRRPPTADRRPPTADRPIPQSAISNQQSAIPNHWLQVKAVAAAKNRDGIGTRVTVTARGRRQTGWIRSGSSYFSAHELVAFFGLGGATQADVELRFPDGTKRTLEGVKAGQRLVVRQ